MKTCPLSEQFHQLTKDRVVAVITAAGEQRQLRITAVRALTGGSGITFDGIGSPEEARVLRGALIVVPKDALILGDGEYWRDDILGLDVVTTAGDRLGTIVDIFSAGASDVYVVEGGGREYLIPAIRDVIVAISPEDGRVIVRVMEGMLD